MVIQMRISLFALLLFFAAIPAPADDQPIEVLRRGIDESLRVLAAPKFNGSDQAIEQRQRLRQIMAELFDFDEFSRRVLASRWKLFSPLEKATFVDVFTDFLTTYYVAKILEKYRDERVVYLGQELESQTRALVHVAVVWRGKPVPVDLWMIKRKGVWKVYEIQVLGISAVSFYRAQFKSLLRKETPAQVIEHIRRRTRKIN
jgi:phospholipid transport system substrate-binding protein